MGADTKGWIKGYVSHEEILNFIRQKWDKNATDEVKKHTINSIKECTWDYKINPHSEDNENWYSVYGFITFSYQDEVRDLFYDYDNVNHLENLEYYREYGLEELVTFETTYISLGTWGNSVEIIKALVAQFGGGWVDENNCDDEQPYPIELDADKSIKPVKIVRMEDIYEKFGCIVKIKE